MGRPASKLVLLDARVDEQGLLEAGEPVFPVGGFLGALPSSPLIGHQDQLRQVIRHVETAAGGEGRLVAITGEPGAGKTRLAQEVTRGLNERQFLVAFGRCYESRINEPFFAFREALQAVYLSGPPELRAHVRDRWPYLSVLLPDSEPAAGQSIHQHVDEGRVMAGASGFVMAAARFQPVAFMIDDLQWADEPSLAMLHYLARQLRGCRVVLLVTYRDGEAKRRQAVDGVLKDLSHEELIDRIPLPLLTKAETGHLALEMMSKGRVSEELISFLYTSTDGNPFYTKELVRALLEDDGGIGGENRSLQRLDVMGMAVPTSVREVITARVSRLPAQSRDVLKAASVLGQKFDYTELLGVSGLDDERLEEALEPAVSAGLVDEMGPDAFRFDHALTHAALYQSLSARQRRKLHLDAGTVLESQHKTQAGVRSQLARHFLEGGDQERGLRYTLASGDEALEVFAGHVAEQQYRTAVGLAGRLGEHSYEAEALQKLGEALYRQGSYDEAIEALQRARDAYTTLGDTVATCGAAAFLGRAHMMRGTLVEGLDALEPLAAALEGAPPRVELAHLYFALGDLHTTSGRPRDGLLWMERSVEVARTVIGEAGGRRILALALTAIGPALYDLGELQDAIAVLEEAVDLAEDAGELDGLWTGLVWQGMALRDTGKFDAAVWCYRRSLEVAERTHDPFHAVGSTTSLGLMEFLLGHWREARRYYEAALDASGSLGTSPQTTFPLNSFARLSMAEGKADEARRLLQTSLDKSEEVGGNFPVFFAQALLSEQDLMEGRPREARDRLAGLFVPLDGGASPPNVLLPTVAWMYLDLARCEGDPAAGSALIGRAEEAARESVEQTRAAGKIVHLVDALRIYGMVLARQERREEASSAFGEAVRLARGLPYPYGEGRALCEWGLMLAELGEVHDAGGRLEEAVGILQGLGATPYLERAGKGMVDGRRQTVDGRR
jgi:tetratricopeptide (TPR) repeat protein/ActR/RegA family two-component response regulator